MCIVHKVAPLDRLHEENELCPAISSVLTLGAFTLARARVAVVRVESRLTTDAYGDGHVWNLWIRRRTDRFRNECPAGTQNIGISRLRFVGRGHRCQQPHRNRETNWQDWAERRQFSKIRSRVWPHPLGNARRSNRGECPSPPRLHRQT